MVSRIAAVAEQWGVVAPLVLSYPGSNRKIDGGMADMQHSAR